jgi:hypothetical protein
MDKRTGISLHSTLILDMHFVDPADRHAATPEMRQHHGTIVNSAPVAAQLDMQIAKSF